MLKDDIIQYFRDGEKVHDDFTMGAEFEHLLVNNIDLQSISFTGPRGIEVLLKQLTQKGWQEIREDERLVGLSKEGTVLTLGPGGQLKLSVQPTKSLKEIDNTYLKFLRDTFPYLEENNQHMLAVGYLPVSKITEIDSVPGIRYELLAKYLPEQGPAEYQMLKGAAATQLAVDYAHQDDFRKKIQVAYALTPAISALFDNAPIFEGEVYQDYSLRTRIGRNRRENRCLIGNIMKKDFGYADYADFLLNASPLFIQDGTEYVYTGEKNLAEIYQDKELTQEAIEHVLTMICPDIRLKQFLELRMADALPYPLNLAYITLWKALLYSQENLDALYEFTMTVTQAEIEQAKEDLIKEGLNAKLGQGTLRDLAKDLFFMSGNYLKPAEAHYLQPLEPLIFQEIIPRDITLRHLREMQK
ncbi:MAG: glutamate-cysteine ligase family protein [Peptococcaceae bacterium]